MPQMTVEENLFLGAEIIRRGVLDKRAIRARAREIIARLGFPLRPEARVEQLTRAEQQMVEIAKAFRSELSVLILDEPTASLTDRETEQLFALIDQVKAQGVGIIYITHRMQEIRRIGDRITVLRDGRYVATLDAKTAEDDELVRLMTGRVISELFPKIRFAPGEERLRIEHLSTPKRTVADVSLTVARRRDRRPRRPGRLGQVRGDARRLRHRRDRVGPRRPQGRGRDRRLDPRAPRPRPLLHPARPAGGGAGDDAVLPGEYRARPRSTGRRSRAASSSTAPARRRRPPSLPTA